MKLPPLIAPTAEVLRNTEGLGSMVFHNCVINRGAIIGKNTIINTSSVIEHDVKIGDHCHIGPRSIVLGEAIIEDETFIGAGAIIFPGVQIKKAQLLELEKLLKMTKTLIIAEIGVNHNGSLEKAKQLIENAYKAGADVVKFQTFSADKLTLPSAKTAKYQLNQTNIDSQHKLLKNLELRDEQFIELKAYCDQIGIEFLSTAFDINSMKFLLELGIRRIKISSGEITNFPFLKFISKTSLPILLSTGMANEEEVKFAVKTLKRTGVKSDMITVLHCTSNYPAKPSELNLNAIKTLAKNTGLKVGYSDHSKGHYASIAAITLGARVIEKHITISKNDLAQIIKPVWRFPTSFFVKQIRQLEKSMGDGIKIPVKSELDSRKSVRKSIVRVAPYLRMKSFQKKI